MARTPEERIGIAEKAIENIETNDRQQWDAINELRRFMHKLIPVWVTVVLMAMSAVTASALTFAGLITKIK